MSCRVWGRNSKKNYRGERIKNMELYTPLQSSSNQCDLPRWARIESVSLLQSTTLNYNSSREHKGFITNQD